MNSLGYIGVHVLIVVVAVYSWDNDEGYFWQLMILSQLLAVGLALLVQIANKRG